MPGGHGKATWNVRGHAWNGGAATNYGSIFSSPHGKHAWNARGVRNISGVLVHGWVAKACRWETYLLRCSMITASLTKSKYTKANLFQKSCMTLLSSAIPPFRGDGQMTKNVQNIYMNIENKFLIPWFLPLFFWVGILPILGGYRPILPSIRGKKWGDVIDFSHQNHMLFICMVQFVHSSIGSGSFTSFISIILKFIITQGASGFSYQIFSFFFLYLVSSVGGHHQPRSTNCMT